MTPRPFSSQDLPALARAAHESCGLTYAQAAQRLGVDADAYEKALFATSGSDALCRRIAKMFTKYRLEGPQQPLDLNATPAERRWENEGGALRAGHAASPESLHAGGGDGAGAPVTLVSRRRGLVGAPRAGAARW